MNKQEFLAKLRKDLSGLPREELEERLAFYEEMIDDRMEEGLSEEEAVRAADSAPEGFGQEPENTPREENASSARQWKAWEIVLLVLGSPIWFSLGIAAVSVVFSLYISVWSVIVSLWAVFGSLVACAVGIAVAGAVLACHGNVLPGIAMAAGGCVCGGLSIFAFFGCRAATKGMLLLTKKFAQWLRNCFTGKERVR